MPIGDKVYFSGLSGSNSLKIDGTDTLLHTFADNNTYETWLYASAPSATTVTLTNPAGSTVDLTVLANTEVALLSGQVLGYDIVTAGRDLYVNSTSEVWVRGYVKSHTT